MKLSSTSKTNYQHYKDDGVVLMRNLLDKAQLSLISAGIEQCHSHPSKRHTDYANDDDANQRFFYDAVLTSDVAEFQAVLRDSSLAEMAAKMMGSNKAIAFYISVFVRSPGTLKRTPWHQDLPYWSAIGNQTCSTWLSVDPVPESTALEFIAGSHQWDSFARPDFHSKQLEDYLVGEQNRAEKLPDIESNRDDYNIVKWDMSPGDCVFFHGMTAHGGSGGLPPELGRRAISIQWLGDDATYQPNKVGGVDPDFTQELASIGLSEGDSLASDVCPVLWP